MSINPFAVNYNQQPTTKQALPQIQISKEDLLNLVMSQAKQINELLALQKQKPIQETKEQQPIQQQESTIQSSSIKALLEKHYQLYKCGRCRWTCCGSQSKDHTGKYGAYCTVFKNGSVDFWKWAASQTSKPVLPQQPFVTPKKIVIKKQDYTEEGDDEEEEEPLLYSKNSIIIDDHQDQTNLPVKKRTRKSDY